VFGIEQWDIVLSNAVLASLSMWKWHVCQKQQDLYKFQLFWKWKGFEFYNSQWSTIMFINRLMHAVFHIWTVIIPRERYGPFNIELQRTKLTSTAYTKLIWVIDIGWVMITVLLWKKSCIDLFIERLDIVLSAFFPISAHGMISLWHFRWLCMGKIDVITYKYVINNYKQITCTD
jgi:hypothetical protein